jgi:hypothetical protein
MPGAFLILTEEASFRRAVMRNSLISLISLGIAQSLPAHEIVTLLRAGPWLMGGCNIFFTWALLPARNNNGTGKLVLPQLNHLHEAFKRSQFSPRASSSSQDQQPTRPSPIPSQRRLTQQLTKQWPQSKALRQHYAGTRFEEQRQLHLPQKHKATVPESTLRVEMNGLEEQADNAKARELFWKPLSNSGPSGPRVPPTPSTSRSGRRS